jgi:transcriptional regulator with XRE-family HTH domain
MVLLRQEIGDVLREQRQHQRRTLREVSAAARVSLGYLSEVERGQKEASSELLASICGALELPLSRVLSVVSERVAETERVEVGVASLPVGQPPRALVSAALSTSSPPGPRAPYLRARLMRAFIGALFLPLAGRVLLWLGRVGPASCPVSGARVLAPLGR